MAASCSFAALLAALLLLLLLIAAPLRAARKKHHRPRPSIAPRNLTLEPYALDAFPSAFVFSPSGSLYYALFNAGKIMFKAHANARPLVFAEVAGLLDGLLGVTLHPTKPLLYVYATINVTEASPNVQNRIIRYTIAGSQGVNATVILADDRSTRSVTEHNGGRLHFGPDLKLYCTTGDNQATIEDNISQNLTSLKGKILRLNDDGSVPSDNPYPGSLVYAYGFRNPYGSTFDANGKLWVSENGPSCNDEINLVVRRANYGWGNSNNCSLSQTILATNRDGPNITLPKWSTYAPLGITGLAFCQPPKCGVSAPRGSLLLADWNFGQIHVFLLDKARQNIVASQVYHVVNTEVYQRNFAALEHGPGGLYISAYDGVYRLRDA